jgi:subtilisin-like proprotein convertase family protein
MRHGYLLLIAVGCGFKSTQFMPDPDELVPGTWSLAGASDLAAPGHVAVDMTIEARGALTPAAYTYGGLAAHGLMNAKLWAHGDVAWAHLDPTMASGAGLWRGDALDTGGALDYLGIPMKPTKVTLWFEGDVWLEAGSNEQFGLHGNDVAFVDIADPGTTRYTPLMESDATMPVAVPVTGWYPIRIGFSDGDGSGDFSFTHADAGAPLIPWTRDRLRARAGELQGAFRTVFGRQILGGGVGPTQLPISYFDQVDLLKATDFDAAPQGVGTDDWSARYAGQVYIAEPGAYTLQITSDDGNRGRLGAAIKETGWSRDFGVGADPAMTTVNATLAAGWNDIILDYNEVGGTRAMHAEIKGPGFSDGPVPRARLRPVESADDRLATAGDDTRRAVPENGGPGEPATAVVKIAGYPGETVAAIDVTYEIDSQHWNQIRVDLEAPATTAGPGVRRMIRDRDSRDVGGNRVLQQTISAGTSELLGGPSGGDWRLHVYDDPGGSGNNTSLKSAKITLHTTGGPGRIAKTASWTSAVFDAASRVRAIDGVTWNQRLPDGGGLEVRVRTCRQADCSDGPAWSPVVTPSTAFDVEPARYLQVRVDMTSNGVFEPELRSLAVMYRRDPD